MIKMIFLIAYKATELLKLKVKAYRSRVVDS